MNKFRKIYKCFILLFVFSLVVVSCSTNEGEQAEESLNKIYSPFLIVDSSIESVIFSDLKHSESVNVEHLNLEVNSNELLKKQVYEMVGSYLKITDHLYKEEFDKLHSDLKDLEQQLVLKQTYSLTNEELNKWTSAFNHIESSAVNVYRNDQFYASEFARLSDDIILFLLEAPIEIPTLFIHFCPASNEGEGANWLSLQENVENPYMGKSGEGCGVMMGVLNRDTQNKFRIYKR